MKKIVVLALLVLLMLIPIVGAHDHPVYFPLGEGHAHEVESNDHHAGEVVDDHHDDEVMSDEHHADEKPSIFPGLGSSNLHAPTPEQGLWALIVFNAWTMHDKIHWIIVVLMLYTCYHFRYAVGRLFGKPGKNCPRTEDEFYNGENRLHLYHRYFWWANVFLLGIHWTEVITGLRFWLASGVYTYTFTYQALGVYVELFYVIAFTLWIASCHFFRFFVGETCGACKGYDRVSRFNDWHGIFMWTAVLSFILLILLQGHL